VAIKDIYYTHTRYSSLWLVYRRAFLMEAETDMKEQQVENEVIVEEEKQEDVCWALLELVSLNRH
jgi:hypothetical protein